MAVVAAESPAEVERLWRNIGAKGAAGAIGGKIPEETQTYSGGKTCRGKNERSER